MKKLLFTFIIAYFISLPLTVTAGPGSHPGEFKDTEFNIGGISFGSSMEYVIEIYGEPSSKEEHIEENSAILTYNYNNKLLISAATFNGKYHVETVTITADNLATPSGFSVGHPYADVENTYSKIPPLDKIEIKRHGLDPDYVYYERSCGLNYMIGPPKTPASTRDVSLPRQVMNLVQEFAATSFELDVKSRLFEVTKSSLHKEMHRVAKAANVKRIRIRDLRHSHASYLIEHGLPILKVSKRLGHEKIETTLHTYAHLYPQERDEALDIMEKDVTISFPTKQKNADAPPPPSP